MYIINVALFTFFQATCSTIIALIIGFPLAFFCGRRHFPLRKLLLSFSVVPFCVPTLIVALGYVTFLGINGGLNQFLCFLFRLQEPPIKILYSFFGLILAQGFYNFPIIMKTVSLTWERIPLEPSESAKLLGASESRIFKTITIYQLIPSILSSCLLVFIYTFLSFIFVLLFGGIGNSTLEVEIYKAARATLNFHQVFILATIETLILCFITIIYTIFEQKSIKANGIEELQKWNFKKLGESRGVEKIIFFIFLLLIIIGFIAPLSGIIWNSFTSPKKENHFTLIVFQQVFKMKSFLPSLKNTLFIGTLTGFFCMILGGLYSCLLKFWEDKSSKFLTIFLKILPIIPMSISSVVVGVAITLIVKRGNTFCLILTQTALMWPLAFKQIYPQISKISLETINCAKLLSKNQFDIIKRVIIPVCKSSFFSAFSFCFALSTGDTTLPLILAIPKLDTLSLFTYRLASSYRFNEACASGCILCFLCVLIFLVGKTKKN